MVNFDPTEFEKMKELHEGRVVEKKSLKTLYDSLVLKRDEAELNLEASEKARIIIQEVAKLTQNNLKVRISNLVTTALLAVDKDWPEFEMLIETRRNQSEVDFNFIEKGKIHRIPEASGVVDITSMALRISMWSLNKNRATFIFDEPFKHLSKDRSQAASKMLKMLCNKLGIQIIMVSHDPEITGFADKVFRVVKTGAVSKVRENG